MQRQSDLDDILSAVPGYRERLRELREIVLANAIMAGEIPAPTFEEAQRVRFLCDRFTESDLNNISTDEKENATAVLPGSLPERERKNILVAAHVDTIWSANVDHSVSVGTDALVGPGIADNSLGLAVIASLPAILDHLGIRLQNNLVLLGATRSMGKGDLEGLRFFIENAKLPIAAALCIEGLHLGRLSYSCIGMMRGEITVRAPEATDWKQGEATGSLVHIHRILSRILAIPTPQHPKTSIVLGSIITGTAYNISPRKAQLRFEVRSEQAGMVSRIQEQIEEIIEEVNAERDANATFTRIARRKPGGIGFHHPLVKTARKIMGQLNLQPKIAPSTSELSVLLDAGISSLTLGVSKGDNRHELNESVLIDPIFSGLAQIVAMLQAIDGGLCDEDD